MKPKRLPIKIAKDIAKNYKQEQVIVVTWDAVSGTTHVVTYGTTIEHCDMAAVGGNKVKAALGWPPELCSAEPSRVKKLQAENKKLKQTILDYERSWG